MLLRRGALKIYNLYYIKVCFWAFLGGGICEWMGGGLSFGICKSNFHPHFRIFFVWNNIFSHSKEIHCMQMFFLLIWSHMYIIRERTGGNFCSLFPPFSHFSSSSLSPLYLSLSLLSSQPFLLYPPPHTSKWFLKAK